MSLKQQIPEIEGVADTKVVVILRGMKNIIDGITGRRISPITSLGTNPSVSGIRNKINEIIARLQGDEKASGVNDPTVNQTLSVGTATAAAHAVRLDQLTASNIVGTTTNDDATAGDIGEFVISQVAGTVVSLATNTIKTVTSISLTAGDWDVSGHVIFITAATTSVTQVISCISTTTDALQATTYLVDTVNAIVPGAGEFFIYPTPTVRLSLASTTTVYLTARALFTISTLTAGGTIRARRVR